MGIDGRNQANQLRYTGITLVNNGVKDFLTVDSINYGMNDNTHTHTLRGIRVIQIKQQLQNVYIHRYTVYSIHHKTISHTPHRTSAYVIQLIYSKVLQSYSSWQRLAGFEKTELVMPQEPVELSCSVPITLPETNIAPEIGPSQKEIHLPTIHFQGLC